MNPALLERLRYQQEKLTDLEKKRDDMLKGNVVNLTKFNSVLKQIGSTTKVLEGGQGRLGLLAQVQHQANQQLASSFRTMAVAGIAAGIGITAVMKTTVAQFDPAAVQRFDFRMRDLGAVVGQIMSPAFDKLNDDVLSFSTFLYNLPPGLKRFAADAAYVVAPLALLTGGVGLAGRAVSFLASGLSTLKAGSVLAQLGGLGGLGLVGGAGALGLGAGLATGSAGQGLAVAMTTGLGGAAGKAAGMGIGKVIAKATGAAFTGSVAGPIGAAIGSSIGVAMGLDDILTGGKGQAALWKLFGFGGNKASPEGMGLRNVTTLSSVLDPGRLNRVASARTLPGQAAQDEADARAEEFNRGRGLRNAGVLEGPSGAATSKSVRDLLDGSFFGNVGTLLGSGRAAKNLDAQAAGLQVNTQGWRGAPSSDAEFIARLQEAIAATSNQEQIAIYLQQIADTLAKQQGFGATQG